VRDAPIEPQAGNATIRVQIQANVRDGTQTDELGFEPVLMIVAHRLLRQQ
jgi:hypothetical protein